MKFKTKITSIVMVIALPTMISLLINTAIIPAAITSKKTDSTT